jgi:hypothetical protein
VSWHATEVRTSRKVRRCWRCRERIQPGQRYERHSLPPGGELGYLGWVREAEHVDGECQTDNTAAAADAPATTAQTPTT